MPLPDSVYREIAKHGHVISVVGHRVYATWEKHAFPQSALEQLLNLVRPVAGPRWRVTGKWSGTHDDNGWSIWELKFSPRKRKKKVVPGLPAVFHVVPVNWANYYSAYSLCNQKVYRREWITPRSTGDFLPVPPCARPVCAECQSLYDLFTADTNGSKPLTVRRFRAWKKYGKEILSPYFWMHQKPPENYEVNAVEVNAVEDNAVETEEDND